MLFSLPACASADKPSNIEEEKTVTEMQELEEKAAEILARNEKKELLFRGVPFGATYKEAKEIWKDSGIDIEKIDVKDYYGEYVANYPDLDSYRDGTAFLEVAGYKMRMSSTFTWESLENSNIDDSILTFASYDYGETIDSYSDRVAASELYFDDLVSKLSDLYGSKVIITQPKDNEKQALWENCFTNPNAQLCLTETVSSTGLSIHISYKDTELEAWNTQMGKDAFEASVNAKKEASKEKYTISDSNDGL